MFTPRASYSKDNFGWRIIYDKQRDDGSAFRTQKRGFRRKKDAEVWFEEYKKKLTQGIDVDGEQMTLSNWLDRWYDVFVEKKSDNTKASYKNNIKHIKKAIGKYTLRELKKDIVQKFYNDFTAPDEKGKCMSTSMLQRVHTTLNQAVKAAIDQGYMLRNPCTGTDRGEPVVQSRLYCTSEQLIRFLELAKKTEYYLPLLMCSLMGLRRGEALGLKWGDIDWAPKDGPRVEIRGQITRDNLNKGNVYKEKLKSSKSRRPMKIPPEVLHEIKIYKRRQSEEKISLGQAYDDAGFVCTLYGGGHMSPNELSRVSKVIFKNARIDPRIHLHDLRHSYATLLRQSGVKIETISELLGHSDIKTTYDFYIGTDTQAADDAADRIGTVIGLTKVEPDLSHKA